MGGWTRQRDARLRARAGGVHRRRIRWGRRQCGMVPAGPAGSVRSIVQREPGLHDPRQRQQHHGHQRHRRQHLSDNHHQQQHHHYQCHLREPECGRRGNRGSAARFHERPTRGQGGRGRERARPGFRAGDLEGCRGSLARERVGVEGEQRRTRGGAAAGRGCPPGRRQGDTPAAAHSLCSTAAGPGSAPGTTPGAARSADLEAGQFSRRAADDQIGARG